MLAHSSSEHSTSRSSTPPCPLFQLADGHCVVVDTPTRSQQPGIAGDLREVATLQVVGFLLVKILSALDVLHDAPHCALHTGSRFAQAFALNHRIMAVWGCTNAGGRNACLPTRPNQRADSLRTALIAIARGATFEFSLLDDDTRGAEGPINRRVCRCWCQRLLRTIADNGKELALDTTALAPPPPVLVITH
jgi:hypothetical protein